VTRSAFYFYFAPSRPRWRADERGVQRDHHCHLGVLRTRYRHTRERLRESLTQGAATWHEHGNLVRALYDGAGNDPEIGGLLDHWLEQLIEVTAQRIERERAAGRAPEGTDAHSLAAVLIGMNERAFLRDLRAGSPPEQIEQTVTALVDAWASTLYRDLG
jgi:hypothetical protein